MTTFDLVMVGVGLLLIVGTGLFVASEFSLINLDRAELEARRDRGETRLSMTIAALKITSTHLSSAQLGITLTTLLTGYTLEPLFSALLRPVVASWGIPAAVAGPLAIVLAIAAATVLSMIIGELVPKNFALALPRQTAKLVIPFQTVFTTIFRPAIAVLNGSANAILRAMGVEPKEELSGARSAEELSSLVRRSANAGLLEADTASLLNRTLLFSRLTAADVMTPRPRMHGISDEDSADDVVALALRTGHSRFPVFHDSLDDIVGVVHLKAAVSVPRERRTDVPAGALATEVTRVPETAHIDRILSDIRGPGYQFALVVDEYGGTAGVLTLEDLVEEIVGEVADEHDRTRTQLVHQRDETSFPAQWRPDELADRADIHVPEGDVYDTVGGFVMSALQRIPRVGDEVALADGTLRVQRMDGRRIDRIRFIPSPPDTAESGADGARPARGGRGGSGGSRAEAVIAARGREERTSS